MHPQARQAKSSADGEESPIPMTVRQLEALIRISESFARMSMSAEADDGHVAAAFDLFTKSTINAMNAGLISNTNDKLQVCFNLCSMALACVCYTTSLTYAAYVCSEWNLALQASQHEEVTCAVEHLLMCMPLCVLQVNATQDVEARICERLHIGGHVTYKRLLEDMQALGYSGNQVGAMGCVGYLGSTAASGCLYIVTAAEMHAAAPASTELQSNMHTQAPSPR